MAVRTELATVKSVSPLPDFSKFADGAVWQLDKGEDFGCDVDRAQSALYLWCSRNNKSGSFRDLGDGSVLVQIRDKKNKSLSGTV